MWFALFFYSPCWLWTIYLPQLLPFPSQSRVPHLVLFVLRYSASTKPGERTWRRWSSSASCLNSKNSCPQLPRSDIQNCQPLTFFTTGWANRIERIPTSVNYIVYLSQPTRISGYSMQDCIDTYRPITTRSVKLKYIKGCAISIMPVCPYTCRFKLLFSIKPLSFVALL